VLAFNPVTFVIAIVITIVVQALQCKPKDQQLAIRKGAGLCVTIGTYCSNKVLGACVTKKQGACCFNSKLARIINQQGRAQLGKSWGSPKSPQCQGFTAAELQSLDFSKMDFTEFYADIHASSLDSAAIQNAVTTRLTSDPSYYTGGSPTINPANPVVSVGAPIQGATQP
jgi:conjugal transfer mating pair stabilization protein TraN